MEVRNHTFPKNNLRKKFKPHLFVKQKFRYNLHCKAVTILGV
jgi:hypothetical protein